MKLPFYLFISVVLLFSACDCHVYHRGVVLEEGSQKPIEHATITFDKRTFSTNASGYFEISYITGFCPEEIYVISADQYKPLEVHVERSEESTEYTVFQRNNQTRLGYTNTCSNSFGVRNDTLIFYLEKQNPKPRT